MASLLGNMDNIAAVPPTKSRKRKPEPETHVIPSRAPRKAPSRANNYSYRNEEADFDSSSDGLADVGFSLAHSDEDDLASSLLSPKKKLKTDTDALKPATDRLRRFHVESSGDEKDVKMVLDSESVFDGVDMDAFMSVDDDFDDEPSLARAKVKKEEADAKIRFTKAPNVSKTQEKKPAIDSTPAWLSVYESLTVKAEDALGPQASSSNRGTSSNASVLEEDGSFRFFWLDYLEHEGRLYFIGKTQDKKSKTWVSCCVTVENLQRNLFVLPRDYRMEEDDETGELCATDVVPSLPDVYNDFDRVRKKLGIKSFKAKFVKRQYAFGESDVPRGEAQWLKVVYPFEGGNPCLLPE